MNIPVRVQHGLVILGVVVLGYILLVPKNKKSKNNSPKVAEDSKVKNLQNYRCANNYEESTQRNEQ